MKIEIKLPVLPKSNKVTRFPVLARNRYTDSIVLFLTDNIGMIVVPMMMRSPNVNESLNIGYYSERWVSITDEDAWEILPEGTQVILTQENPFKK